jgi:hypothetical protein
MGSGNQSSGGINNSMQTPLQHGGGAGNYGQVGAPNPWLNQQFNRAADSVEGRMRDSTQFQGLSNSGVQQMYNRNLNDLAQNVYGGAYEQDANRRLSAGQFMSQSQQTQRNQDLNRMMSASQQLPGMMQAGTQYGLGIGDIYRDLDQARINEGIRAFEEQRMYPYQQLDVLGRSIGMSMGGQGTTTTTGPGYYQPSGTSGMLGGALTGLGLLQALKGGN